MQRLRPATIAIAAIMTAIAAVLTLLVRVPIPATQGYYNFGDVAVFFGAFAFGPLIGLVAGGIGPAIADVLGGYAFYAPITLLAHGLQGFLAGWIGRGGDLRRVILGWGAGALAMMAVYFVAQWILYGVGAAAVEAPFNLLQNVGGGLLGVPLYYLVRRAYPPILHMGRPGSWREE